MHEKDMLRNISGSFLRALCCITRKYGKKAMTRTAHIEPRTLKERSSSMYTPARVNVLHLRVSYAYNARITQVMLFTRIHA